MLARNRMDLLLEHGVQLRQVHLVVGHVLLHRLGFIPAAVNHSAGQQTSVESLALRTKPERLHLLVAPEVQYLLWKATGHLAEERVQEVVQLGVG